MRLQIHLLDLAREVHDGDLLRVEVTVGRDVGTGSVLLSFVKLLWFLILVLFIILCVLKGRGSLRWWRFLNLCLLILVALGLLFFGLLLQKYGRERINLKSSLRSENENTKFRT